MKMVQSMNRLALVALLSSAAARLSADENQWLVPLGAPPRSSPRRISGGEGFPPLPLPVTPLRRSERKRQPRPPTMAGKVIWGETAEYRHADGQTQALEEWNLAPDDLNQLMRKAGRWFGLNYGTQPVSLAETDPDPSQTPLLFFSGVRTLRMDEEAIRKLRRYVLRGGMICFDSIAGSPYFTESALDAARRILPGEALRRLPLDHPLFHMLADAGRVGFARNREGNRPEMFGIYVGSRVGILVSPIGMGCGWDGHDAPMLERAVIYDVDSADRLGLNLVAYAIGYAEAARLEAMPELFGTMDEQRPTDELVFAQLRHEGAWDVHPGSAAALLRRLRAETAARVSLRRISVDPARDNLGRFTLLYLEGLDDFSWSEDALHALRAFLQRGGTLLVSNGLGLSSFDTAVRRELARLLPDATLAPVPAGHALFDMLHTLEDAAYTPAALAAHPNRETPWMEAIEQEGDLRVIYSPLDLSAAWMGCDYPLARAFRPETGNRLGMNLLIYAMTH